MKIAASLPTFSRHSSSDHSHQTEMCNSSEPDSTGVNQS